MALNVKQQIKKQGFETLQRKKKTERRYNDITLAIYHNSTLYVVDK